MYISFYKYNKRTKIDYLMVDNKSQGGEQSLGELYTLEKGSTAVIFMGEEIWIKYKKEFD